MFGVPVNEELCTLYTAKLEQAMAGYERLLSKQEYLAGDVVTLADLFHVPWGCE